MINGQIVEKMNQFNYLVNDTGYDKHCDIYVKKVGKFQTICKTNNLEKRKVEVQTKSFTELGRCLYCPMDVNYGQQLGNKKFKY